MRVWKDPEKDLPRLREYSPKGKYNRVSFFPFEQFLPDFEQNYKYFPNLQQGSEIFCHIICDIRRRRKRNHTRIVKTLLSHFPPTKLCEYFLECVWGKI